MFIFDSTFYNITSHAFLLSIVGKKRKRRVYPPPKTMSNAFKASHFVKVNISI